MRKLFAHFASLAAPAHRLCASALLLSCADSPWHCPALVLLIEGMASLQACLQLPNDPTNDSEAILITALIKINCSGAQTTQHQRISAASAFLVNLFMVGKNVVGFFLS